MIERSELEGLIRHPGSPAVTITMPCGRPGPAPRRNAIRLGDLVDKAGARLEAQGYQAVVDLLWPAEELVHDDPFWAKDRQGLAIFLSPGFSRILEPDQPVEEMVSCGSRFRIAPLLAEAKARVIGPLSGRSGGTGGTERASTDPAQLVKAACRGRVDTLLLGEGTHLWGRVDEAGDRLETHAEPQAADDDLLDVAAQQTLLNGGRVMVVPPERMPARSKAAGIMRHPAGD